ncbi:acyl-CoA thioesterase [Pandoraea apista]|uniref:Acyl-CoA thioesterase n=1 Tax=Pandoraea apista TaxID=93218 RepID=A0ABX9ZMY3_9BURK|nr:thioesterase family protein [Pandoraea apista]PTE00768.1 acyl-CoA thioesterase [Pandoraea apista]RRJ32744.1 acyl-CoA thioesterase [Pandoraea apista]RRJ74637.1 acyl-CoA thioesterase [Pandoraea apista]RSD08369.1 acyl-CoA thioesterase [Pandoraea apista]RSK76223.1 acyl-CoA thioesterase [Pandoraea apista]
MATEHRMQHDAAAFVRESTIRFHHCDPAGIVFYPQYLVMLHEFVEQWFDDGLALPYATFIGEQRLGIPVVRLDCEFFAPSRLGDRVDLSLIVLRLGNSAIDLVLEVHGKDAYGTPELRMRAKQTVVVMSLETHRSVAIAPSLRDRMSAFLMQAEAQVPSP